MKELFKQLFCFIVSFLIFTCITIGGLSLVFAILIFLGV